MKLIYSERRSPSKLWLALFVAALGAAVLLFGSTASHHHASTPAIHNDSTASAISLPQSAVL
jgi:hypothetical protein